MNGFRMVLATTQRLVTTHSGILVGILLLAVVIAAYVTGAGIYRDNFEDAKFYRGKFAPALVLACHGKYQARVPTRASTDFLRKDSKPIDCSAVVASPDGELLRFQNRNRSLLYLAGVTWKIFGIDWMHLDVIAGLFTAAFVLATFFLLVAFRINPFVAITLAASTLLLPTLTSFIPDLRDFSRAPFIVAGLAILVMLVTQTLAVRKLLIYTAALGLVFAVGYGFRSDLKMFFLLLPAALLLIPATLNARQHLTRLGIVLGFFLVTSLAFSLPRMLASDPHVSLNTHTILRGYAYDYWEDLGLRQKYYHAIPHRGDISVWHMTLLQQGSFVGSDLVFKSAEYAAAADEYAKTVMRTLPYDTLMRVPYAVTSLSGLQPFKLIWGLPLVIMLAALALWNWRLAATWLLLLSILMGLSTVQFQTRHFFYVSIFALVLLGSFLTAAGGVFRNRYKLSPAIAVAFLKPRLVRIGIFIVVILALAQAVFMITAKIQSNRLEEINQAYQALPWRNLELRSKAKGNAYDIVSPVVIDNQAIPISSSIRETLEGGWEVYTQEGLENLAALSAGTMMRITYTPGPDCRPRRNRILLSLRGMRKVIRRGRMLHNLCGKTEYYLPVPLPPFSEPLGIEIIGAETGSSLELAVADVKPQLVMELVTVEGRIPVDRVDGSLPGALARILGYRK